MRDPRNSNLPLDFLGANSWGLSSGEGQTGDAAAAVGNNREMLGEGNEGQQGHHHSKASPEVALSP